jgi:hypothetical protein
MLYTVICHLGRPAAEYPTLSGAIQAAGIASWPVNEATWLIESDHSPDAIRDSLNLCIEDGDFALVFPTNVGPGRWTSLAEFRYGRQFLAGALRREQTPAGT